MDAEVDAILVAAEELKRPLVDLRQLALSFVGAGTQDERVRDEMLSVSDRAIRQVNDLMRLRRLEGAMFEMEPVAVRVAVNEVMRDFYELFTYNRRRVEVKCNTRMPLVMANKEMLKSVVYNFLVSATFCKSDTINSRLIVQSSKDKVKITVRDYGPALMLGTWRKMQSGVMEMPLVASMRPGTSGLSLFIASRMAQLMNGRVGAVRHKDGASFYVELLESRQARLF
ncbi:HAMP domain-containing histidine kinase [Candidatus Saccharibacteria bacterium]|nr:HAMP domain-containing histidine kinase [Candidatus Saccharibacteria bacterium]